MLGFCRHHLCKQPASNYKTYRHGKRRDDTSNLLVFETPPEQAIDRKSCERCQRNIWYQLFHEFDTWLAFKKIKIINVNSFFVAINSYDYRKPNCRFGGSNRHHKKHQYLSRLITQKLGECYQSQVYSIEHQLDAHKNDDRISTKQHTGCSDREQDR